MFLDKCTVARPSNIGYDTIQKVFFWPKDGNKFHGIYDLTTKDSSRKDNTTDAYYHSKRRCVWTYAQLLVRATLGMILANIISSNWRSLMRRMKSGGKIKWKHCMCFFLLKRTSFFASRDRMGNSCFSLAIGYWTSLLPYQQTQLQWCCLMLHWLLLRKVMGVL